MNFRYLYLTRFYKKKIKDFKVKFKICSKNFKIM